MSYTPDPSTATGVIYHKILKPGKHLNVNQIHAKLEKLGIDSVMLKNVASRMVSLIKSGLVEREKIDGAFVYRRAGEESKEPKGTHLEYGHLKRAILEMLQNNIGVVLDVKQIASMAQIPVNSSIHGQMAKLVKAGYAERITHPTNNRALSWKAKPEIKHYGQQQLPLPEPEMTVIPSAVQRPAAMPQITAPDMPHPINEQPNLLAALQQIIDQTSKLQAYEQALVQIAAILEQIDIIEKG